VAAGRAAPLARARAAQALIHRAARSRAAIQQEERPMAVQQNVDRIRTTHVGSLPRPRPVLDMMKAKAVGGAVDPAAFDREVAKGCDEIVKIQRDCGVDIVSDGEVSKPGFFSYVNDRLEGFEPRPDMKVSWWPKEVSAFPEYYERYFKEAMLGGMVAKFVPLACVGPIKYKSRAAIDRDIANLKAAAAKSGAKMVFMPAIGTSGIIGKNEYYKSDEEYFHAIGRAMSTEYRAIIDAGFFLQIDDPFLPDIFLDDSLDAKQQRRRAQMYVESINEGIKGLPVERIRFHTCYSINEGPRIHEVQLGDFIEFVLAVNASAYSFEAANPRHEHDYHTFERVKLPDGKVVIPGMITHASNIVEHPELIAERLMRFTNLCGRENVLAGADCGFSSQATYCTEVDPKVLWTKFKALAEGARIASGKLWK
jgi:5-methyltetrahydropteroyltriglutamate--homocysteine methyltransferase